MKIERGSGIVMHITSLPNKYGIGTFGKEAYEFCDFLKKSGQKYWQILPLGHTSYGDSPYQSFSAFAGNPYFIDLDLLCEENLLKNDDYDKVNFGKDKNVIDYGAIFTEKMRVLKIAYNNFIKIKNRDFEQFKEDEKEWLNDYSVFMALKYKLNFSSWSNWDDKLKFRDKKTLEEYKKTNFEDIEFWNFIQYKFFKQYENLKKYANDNNIQIIGDIPIYVAHDSVDVWSKPDEFLIDKNTMMISQVAGCPPDAFSEDGQLWGNPLYDWEYAKSTGYKWWINRIKKSLRLYDVLRLDHFRGFESFYAVPYGESTARNGKWIKGPGIDLFNAINKELGEVKIIAEDLGFLTKDTLEFIKEAKFPGMKVIQFAFSGDSKNPHLPHNYEKNCVVYTGTHDNDTVRGWLETTGNKKEVDEAKIYFNLTEDEGYNFGIIRGAWSSAANLSMALIQDVLNLGNETRMNMPSTLGGNWCWRAEKDSFTDELAEKLYKITKMYGRCE